MQFKLWKVLSVAKDKMNYLMILSNPVDVQ